MKIPNSELFYKSLLDCLFDPVYYVDLSRTIKYWNNAAEQLTGYSKDEVLGECCTNNILSHIDTDGTSTCQTNCPLKAAFRSANTYETEMYLQHKNGHRLPVTVRVSPVRDDRGKIIGAIEIFRDNSAQKRLLERCAELEQQALLDELTNLPNRRYLEAQLATRIDEWQRFNWPFGVIFMDVDDFKKINDLHGHEVGDKVLKMVANTLSSNSRLFDIVGRWGGEEFMAIIANAQYEQLLAIGERFRVLVSRSELPENGHIRITVSSGATMVQRGEQKDVLLQRADELLYQAKKSGKNQVCG